MSDESAYKEILNVYDREYFDNSAEELMWYLVDLDATKLKIKEGCIPQKIIIKRISHQEFFKIESLIDSGTDNGRYLATVLALCSGVVMIELEDGTKVFPKKNPETGKFTSATDEIDWVEQFSDLCGFQATNSMAAIIASHSRLKKKKFRTSP